VYQALKITPCPSCRATGALILHGNLFGYGDDDEHRKCRGRRIFCDNRKQHNNGCGRTFSICVADRLRRLRPSASTLWAFFTLVISLGNTAQALRSTGAAFSISSAYRLWKRFLNTQSRIRTALAGFCASPTLPDVRKPAAQTVAHLQSAFPSEPSPIAAFQHQLQVVLIISPTALKTVGRVKIAALSVPLTVRFPSHRHSHFNRNFTATLHNSGD